MKNITIVVFFLKNINFYNYLFCEINLINLNNTPFELHGLR